ncbi:ABC transporter permease EcsB [Staphylococcus simulans]|uniref:ABC transporter permease EcsB n=1 Tax=Staphylococcus simulans TaxID=1286 RepID=UPI000D04515E|nr:ABC transporter permease [Staphylococcus simulans]
MTDHRAVALFNQRRQAISKEKAHYNKFIFNGHFSVFLLILFGAFLLGYGNWLKHIPTGIPYALLASLAVAVISIFPLRTLLKEADRLFLLPFERHMSSYLKYSMLYSYLGRVALQIVVLIVLFPLFNKLDSSNFIYFVLFAISALIYPYLGLLAKLEWIQANRPVWVMQLVQWVYFALTYFIILGAHQWLGIILIFIFASWIVLLKKGNQQRLLPWERLIAIEQQHHMNYYKFVNMFTDVKHLRSMAVRRRYLDFLLVRPNANKYNAKHMYLFLFKRSFLRGKDALNIILRLVILTLILMIWLSNQWISLIVGGLFMYIIILQTAQFYTQQAYGLWPQVWPVPEERVIQGYAHFLYHIMFAVAIILTITYVILFPAQFYFALLFFIVGFLTIRNIVKKLKYQEALLRD